MASSGLTLIIRRRFKKKEQVHDQRSPGENPSQRPSVGYIQNEEQTRSQTLWQRIRQIQQR